MKTLHSSFALALIALLPLSACTTSMQNALQDLALHMPAITPSTEDAILGETETCRTVLAIHDHINATYGTDLVNGNSEELRSSASSGLDALGHCTNPQTVFEYTLYFRFMRAWADSYAGTDPYNDINDLEKLYRGMEVLSSEPATIDAAHNIIQSLEKLRSHLKQTSDGSIGATSPNASLFPCRDAHDELQQAEAEGEQHPAQLISSAEETNAHCDEIALKTDNESYIEYIRAIRDLRSGAESWRQHAASADDLAHSSMSQTSDTEILGRLRARRGAIYKLYQEHQ